MKAGTPNIPLPEQPAMSAASPLQVELLDVWSRWGPRYRRRAIVLLIVNILLFSGVACFAYWLRTGLLFAPVHDDYWPELSLTFHGVGRAEVSLGSLLIQPISVQDVPMQIPIVGLLMAALISIPILVALLYRFWSSVPFIAIVAFLAVMPWLAFTLLASCALASMKPFRTRFRFMSALIGLVPVIIYLILAWAGTAEIIQGRIDPVDRIKFITPWVFAIVAATVAFAVVLAIAKLVNFRPGAITPLLALMLALPVVLFETNVGRDELYYRLLESMDQAYFTDTNAVGEWRRDAERTWQQHPAPRPSWESIRDVEQEKWLFELTRDFAPREAELARHQLEVSDRCDRFLRWFPTSPYATNAAFIKARVWDRRLDLGDLRAAQWIRYYDNFPTNASGFRWHVVLENRPDCPLGAVALLRLAQLEVREGRIDPAMQYLSTLIQKFDVADDRFGATLNQQGALGEVLARETPENTLRIQVQRVVLEGRQLHELLLNNRDPKFVYEPITGRRVRGRPSQFGLASLDPRSDHYVQQLEELKKRYPGCELEDNIELEIAKATRDASNKERKLEALIERFPERDAVPEALMRLGLACLDTGDSPKSADAFARLQRDYAQSIWARESLRFGRSANTEQVSTAEY